jgi:hypothetical protein
MDTHIENEKGAETLSESVSHMLEECRMVLPGIQALFGFQLIAVFNSTFWTNLDPLEQQIHYLAIALVALSVALVMTPAAYHRQSEPMTVSRRFLTLSTKLLFWSMYPLMSGIVLDFYLIGTLILQNRLLSLLASGCLLCVCYSSLDSLASHASPPKMDECQLGAWILAIPLSVRPWVSRSISWPASTGYNKADRSFPAKPSIAAK